MRRQKWLPSTEAKSLLSKLMIDTQCTRCMKCTSDQPSRHLHVFAFVHAELFSAMLQSYRHLCRALTNGFSMRGGILCYFLFLALFCFLFLFENFKTTLPTYTNIHSHTYTPTFFFSFLLVNNQSIDPSNPDNFILPHNTTCRVEMLESITSFRFLWALVFHINM